MYKISAKIDNTVNIPEECKSTTPPMPHAVKIDLMRTCNYRCSFCYHSQLDKKKGAMDFELYKKIIRELKEVGVEEVAPFFFGESFLHPQLPEAIKVAKDEGFKYVFLTTNGSIASPEKVKACMEAGLDSLKFSLNYVNGRQLHEIAHVHEKIFDKVIQNIKDARRVRDEGNFDCGLYASYIRYDDKQEELMQPLLKELEPYLDEAYALPLYNQAAKIKHEGWSFSGGNRGRADAPVAPLPCWALFREGHINYDGTLCACCFSVDDGFSMGDLTKQSFKEAWHSEKFQKLRQAHLNFDIRGTPCEGCIIQTWGDQ